MSEHPCACAEPGFCERRGCTVASIHWKLCQRGAVAAMDRLYKAAVDTRERRPKVDPITMSDIGSQLERIIERETGEHLPCSACREEIQRLNQRSKQEVLEELDSIVEGIMARGKNNLGWWSPRRWAISLAPAQVSARVAQWVQEAVKVSTRTPPSAPKPPSDVPRAGSDEAARGSRTGITRRKVLELRRDLQRNGVQLPPLESKSAARTLTRTHRRAAKSINGVRRGLSRHWMSAFTRTCIFVGESLRGKGCGCGAGPKVQMFRCNHESGPQKCVLSDAELKRITDPATRLETASCSSCSLHVDLPRFITAQQYMTDVRKLSSMLPVDLSLIVGVARSGLCAATMISMLHHVPMDIVRQQQGDVISGGNGWRLQLRNPRADGTVVVIDDTCMTGNSLRAINDLVATRYPGRLVKFATVYANPLATQLPDFWAVDLPWPHLLEWNLFNSVLLPACAMDFDGILCHDCPPGDDDDGPRYLEFLASTRPLYPVRRHPIPMVVTARLERYREPTMAWLQAHGVEVKELVMGPWQSLRERTFDRVVEFKAHHYREFMKRRIRPGPHLFIESDVRQARRIAELAKGVVVCPAAGQCFS